MKIYLLSYTHSSYGDNVSTGKKLAEDCEFKFITNPNTSIEDNDTLIRYGVWEYGQVDHLFDRVLNPADSIKTNINKPLAHVLMAKEGVNVPKIYLHSRDIDEFPIIARARRHSQGRGLWLIRSPEELSKLTNYAYFMPFIFSKKEYRIHVMGDKIIRISLKIPMECRPDHHPWIRSFHNGWKLRDDTFSHNRAIEKDASLEAIKGLKALHLDFGAADILIEENTNKPFVLEINSAPRLNERGRRLYKEAFKYYLTK